MSEEAKKVALPAYLSKRLDAFKIFVKGEQSFVLRDKIQSKTYDFEPWQFFVLEVLPGCEDWAKLTSVFQDRFGRPITIAKLKEFFGSVADRKLLGQDAESHPLLAPFCKPGYILDDEGKAQPKLFIPGAAPAPSTSTPSATTAAANPPAAKPAAAPAPPAAAGPKPAGAIEELPAGLKDAVNFDPEAVREIFKVFDPRPMIRLLMPVVRPLHYLTYLLPLMALVAIFIGIEYGRVVWTDLLQVAKDTTFFEHVLFSLFSINILSTLITAFTAHYYRATVSAIGIGINLGFLPRFMATVTGVKQLTRRERLWLAATPLLLRIGLLSLGALVWYNTRGSSPALASVALGMALLCTCDMVITANPLVKGSAYHMLSAFTDEPELRGKAYRALLNKLHGKVYKQADNNLLAAYALATFLFMFVVIVAAMLLLQIALQQLQLGGTAIILVTALGIYLFYKFYSRFSEIEEKYQLSAQFDVWRERALPPEVADETLVKVKKSSLWSYAMIALPLTLLILLILPYSYEPGGSFTVYANQQVAIATDVGGIVESVKFEGGETGVVKGTTIARLASNDLQAQVQMLNAQMEEQQWVIDNLKARPKPEQVKVAESEVAVAMQQAAFSKAKVPRLEDLFKIGAVSFEELENARRAAEVDADQVVQKQAQLELTKAGATVQEIAAAEAKWVSLKEERDGYVDKIRRTDIRMPINGNILTLHLQNKLNSYLEKGAVFATVEDADYVTVEIEVPESDIRYVKLKAGARVRPSAFFDEDFDGTVHVIDRNVATSRSLGSVIKVIALVKNRDGKLRTGMTGYAKMDSVSMPVWKAFTLSLIRFFTIQVWSWIP